MGWFRAKTRFRVRDSIRLRLGLKQLVMKGYGWNSFPVSFSIFRH